MKTQFLGFFFLISSCGYYNTKIPLDAATIPGVGQGGGTNNESSLDFATVKTQVFQNHCLRCHSQAGGNKGGVNLETYPRVKPIALAVLSAVESGFMPPAGPLPNATKTILANWVQSGALEFGSGPSNPPQGNIPNPNPGPNPIPVPVPCEDHQAKIENGEVANVDGQFYIDFGSEALIRRDDDCDDESDDDRMINSLINQN